MKKEVQCPACKITILPYELKQFTSPKLRIRYVRSCPFCRVPLTWSPLPYFIDLLLYIASVLICFLFITGIVSEIIYVFALPILMLGFLMSTWAWKLVRAKPDR